MRTFFVMDVENRRGVLERIASVLRRRMLQIETIVAAPTPDPARAVITFVVDTDDYGIQRITTGLAKIVEVISIHHRQDASGPVIESAIVHFSDGAGERRASSNPDSLLIHASGNPQAIDRFLKLLEKPVASTRREPEKKRSRMCPASTSTASRKSSGMRRGADRICEQNVIVQI